MTGIEIPCNHKDCRGYLYKISIFVSGLLNHIQPVKRFVIMLKHIEAIVKEEIDLDILRERLIRDFFTTFSPMQRIRTLWMSFRKQWETGIPTNCYSHEYRYTWTYIVQACATGITGQDSMYGAREKV